MNLLISCTRPKIIQRISIQYPQVSIPDRGWMNITDQEARQMGFVSNYASTETQEDFVETIAIYVTYTNAQWQSILNEAGEAGAAIILQKFEMVKEYLAESWGIDIDMLHNIVQEREENIGDLDLGTL